MQLLTNMIGENKYINVSESNLPKISYYDFKEKTNIGSTSSGSIDMNLEKGKYIVFACRTGVSGNYDRAILISKDATITGVSKVERIHYNAYLVTCDEAQTLNCFYDRNSTSNPNYTDIYVLALKME